MQQMNELYAVQQRMQRDARTYAARARREIQRLLLVFVFWLVCSYSMATMGVIASIRAPRQAPLPDIGFDLFALLPDTQLHNTWMALIVSNLECHRLVLPSSLFVSIFAENLTSPVYSLRS
jgi:hypothetical protein